jgi:hypothetical protein
MLDFMDKEDIVSTSMNDLLDNNEWLAVRGLIYFEEARIVRIFGRLRRTGRITAFGFLLRISFFVLLVLKVILFLCPVVALQFVPFASLGISAWRLRRRDYGDADGNIANIAKLAAELDIFYALVALLSVFTIYWMFLVGASDMLSVYNEDMKNGSLK